MKKISNKEQKKILLEMLSYVHNLCVDNNINYTLIGGSLIGAVREKGIIPWDDDVDIILLKEDYERLIKILVEHNGKYRVITHEIQSDYYYPFAKLIDTNTFLKEKNQKEIENYGVFLDIFFYNEIVDDRKKQEKYIKKLNFIKQFITGFSYDKNVNKLPILKYLRNKLSNILGIDYILKKYYRHIEKYNKSNSNFLVSCWPIYGVNKEIQKKTDFIEFDIVDFDNIKAMIVSNYDSVLKTTFGNYMVRPSKDKQVTTHSFDMYWNEDIH